MQGGHKKAIPNCDLAAPRMGSLTLHQHLLLMGEHPAIPVPRVPLLLGLILHKEDKQHLNIPRWLHIFQSQGEKSLRTT